VLKEKGDLPAAIATMRRAASVSRDTPSVAVNLARYLLMGTAGNRREGLAMLTRMATHEQKLPRELYDEVLSMIADAQKDGVASDDGGDGDRADDENDNDDDDQDQDESESESESENESESESESEDENNDNDHGVGDADGSSDGGESDGAGGRSGTAAPVADQGDPLAGSVRARLARVMESREAFARCKALNAEGRYREGFAECERSARADPSDPYAPANAAFSCYWQHDYDCAMRYFERALAIEPGLPGIHNGLASAYLMLGKLDEAVRVYDLGIAVTPDDPVLVVNRIHAKARVCEWGEWPAMRRTLREFAARIPAQLNAFHAIAQDLTAAQVRAVASARAGSITAQMRQRGATFRPRRRIRRPRPVPGSDSGGSGPSASGSSLPPPKTQPSPPSPPSPPPSQPLRAPRIRLGYISSDFTNHPVGHKMMPVFGLHNASRFEVFCYSTCAPGDEATLPRRMIERDCEHFHQVGPAITPEALAEMIGARDRIEILVDLNGYTEGARHDALALRPAPVQAMYLGYAGTLGAEDYIDYLVADRFSAPAPTAREQFTEKLVVLPHNLIVSHYSEYRADVLDRGAAVNRTEHGLPEDAVLLCNFNQHHKLDPVIFAAWMRILRRAPENVVLWIQRSPAEAEARLRRAARAAGVDDGTRLVFTGRFPLEDHIAIKVSRGRSFFFFFFFFFFLYWHVF
jgi:tetratricopeptide (TPR) repeat protein